MRDEYKNILDEMAQNVNIIQYIDGRNLLSYLQVHDVIDYQEQVGLVKLGPKESILHLIKVILKPREDMHMTHFLNSLRCAKYDDAFRWLTEKLENLTNEHQSVQNFDEKRNLFIWGARDPTVNFIGREAQLQELHIKMLQSGKKVGADANKIVIFEKTSAITGLGGIGKTQLALRYVQLYGKEYNDNIIWINAKSDATLRNSFIHLAEYLNINIKHTNGVEKKTACISKEVYTHFSTVKCLFVFDNADEPLKPYFYPNGRSKIFILITSRYRKWEPVDVFHLDNFSPKEASGLIRISLKISVSEDQVANLAKTLHFFPLMLKQAIDYINETSEIKKNIGGTYSIDDYIKEYNESKEKLLNYKLVSKYDEYFQTTFTTWKITINKLAKSKAINILYCISYFAQEKIDKKIFVQGENDEETGVAVRLLKEYSLITEEKGLLNVHPFVQEVTRLNIKQKRVEKETFTTVYRLLLSYFEHLERSNDYDKQKILLPHFEKLLQEMKNWLIENPSQQKYIEQEIIKNLLIQMSNAYFNIGQRWQEKSVLEQLLSIEEEQFEPDHYEVAITLVNLGEAHRALGQPERQKTVLEKALPILEKHYGPHHYEVATTLVDLGNAYGALGHPEKQKTLLEEALAIEKKHYGSDHYEVAVTLVNLSNAYEALRQHEKQITLLEEALAIQKQHYKPDHYEVGITVGNLGVAYGALGQHEKQISLLEEALEIKEIHGGTDHYEVARTLVNLGNAYGALGRHKKQISLLEKALEIQKKPHEPDHYEAVTTLESLGIAYGHLGDHENEKTFLEMALTRAKAHYGENHIIVSKILTFLSNTYESLGYFEEQKASLKKALAINKKHFGQDSYEVARTLKKLSAAYGNLNEKEKRKCTLEKAREIEEKCYSSSIMNMAQN